MEALHRIKEAAHGLTREIRASFPVEGLPWAFEGSEDEPGAVCNVVNSATRLDELLYPLRLPFDATLYHKVRLLNNDTPPEHFLGGDAAELRSHRLRDSHLSALYGFASFTSGPSAAIEHVKSAEAMRRIPAAIHTALRAVAVCHDQLLRHYQWGQWVAGDTTKPWPWQWPDVPAIPQSHLGALDRAADHLEDLAAAELSKVERCAAPLNPNACNPNKDHGTADDSAYRPATEFLDSTRFKTYKRLHAALKGNPWIQRDKPSPRRLRIHAGDWLRYLAMLNDAGFDALDVSAETADAFMAEVRQRREEIRQKKPGK
jgi:hypothetical protein